MAVRILMPALSPTMTEGTVARWLKREGDAVQSGDVIAEIETDKATVELEAVEAGTIESRLVPDGAKGIKVNDVIAILREEGDDEAAIAAALAGDTKADAAKARPHAVSSVSPAPPRTATVAPATAVTAPAAAATVPGRRILASPLARRLASERRIDLSALSGSGPHGRIIRRDVETAPTGSVAPTMPAQAPVGMPAGADFRDEPVTTFRRTVAARMVESVQTVPHFYLSIDCRIDALLALRKQINDLDSDAQVSVNDLIIRAAALALMDRPEANVAWMGETIRHHASADISVAVATPRGLITPIIRGAERKSVVTIGREMRDLALRARGGKLKPGEYQGGTFTISNLGMFGIKQFDAIINPPQACLLAVGAGEKRPIVAEDGTLSVATLMTVTLAVDHRAVDGAVGAEYLAAFKKVIESPLRLLL